MKPEKLVMRNFGPFLGEERLDFTALEDIFLIMGKTGAGKTSIFDAMCFALYGQTPRNGRNADFLTSDFNKNRDESSVTLFFSIRESHYKIYRTLFYTRKAKRGSKDVEEEILSLEEVREDGTLAALNGDGQNKSDTERAIERLIGLNAEQFMKIVLLPQGEFAEFLKQNTNERRTLLGKLFPMDEAKKIMQKAAEKAKAAEAELRELENKIAEWGRLYDLREREGMDEIVQKAETRLESVKKRATDALQTEKELVELRGVLKNATEKRNALQNAETEAEHAEKNLAAAQNRFNEAEREKEALPELADKQNALIKRQAVVAELAKAEAEIPALNDTVQRYHKRTVDIAAETAVLHKTLDETRQSIASLEKEAEGLAGLEADFEKARKIYDGLLALQKIVEEKAKAASDEKNVEAAVARLVADADELSAQIAELEQQIDEIARNIEAAKQNAAASELAKTLADGEPCPVCGSTEHPAPAKIVRLAEDLAKSKAAFENMLKEKKDGFAGKSNDKAVMAEKGNAARTRLGELTAAEAEARKNLSFDESAEVLDVAPMLKARLDELNRLQREKEGARRALGRLPGLQKDSLAIRDKLAAFDVERSRLETEEKNTRLKIEEIEAKKKALLFEAHDAADVDNTREGPPSPEGGRGHSPTRYAQEKPLRGAAREELAGIESSLARLDKAIEAIREKGEKAGKDFVEAQAHQENARKTREAAASALAEAEAALLVARSGEYRNLALVSIEGKLADIAGEKDALGKERDEAVAQFTRVTKDRDDLRETEAKRETLSRECGALKAVADDLNGSGKNRAKISFDTWLLARHMNEIAAFASVRLNMMSEGRFHILLDEDGQKGGGGLKGLELTIFDENTGTSRPCATLSGGESFLASISLAMGLADSVQSRAGGIKLDAVFIDEGFGTLDESTLEKALGIFDELSANRMVALISHVEELRTRIPSHVDVVKTKGGSHILVDRHEANGI
jgi:exonuclease SbcC